MKLVGRRLLKVYLDAEDFTRVTARANEERQAVSEYVRELVLEDLDAVGEFERVQRTKRVRVAGRRTNAKSGMGGVAVKEPEASVGEVVAGELEERAAVHPKGKYCAHGTQKGYRCWQCGGKAVIE
jgi:hypothetical protein